MMAPSSIVTISFNGLGFSMHQAQLACALNLCPDISDETRSSILGSISGGPGAPSIPCHALVREIERSRPDIFAAVANNATYWELEARREYWRWFQVISQIVQRYVILCGKIFEADSISRLSNQGRILPYLEPPETDPGPR